MGADAVTDLLVARSSTWKKYALGDVQFSSGRDLLVAGAYTPTAATTGVPAGGPPLVPATSAAQLPGGALTPGATYSDRSIQFVLQPPTGSTPIVFRNCEIIGPLSYGSVSQPVLVRAWTAGHCPVEFYDCTFRAQAPGPTVNGIQGYGFKLIRCDLSAAVDLISVSNAADPTGPLGVEVRQCYLHDMLWYSQANGGGFVDGNHNDALQLSGGSGFVFVGNNVQAFNGPNYFNTYYGTACANTAVLIKPDVGVISGLDFRLSRLSGGGSATLIVNHDSPDHILTTLGVLKNNGFVQSSARTGISILGNRTPAITVDYGTAGVDANTYTAAGYGPGTRDPAGATVPVN